MLKSVRLFRWSGALRTAQCLPSCSRVQLSSSVGKAPITIQQKGFPRVIANPTWFGSLKKEVRSKLWPSIPKIFTLAAVKLYHQCANGIPFLEFIERFSLKDDIDSWVKITVLHIWLVLLRLSKENAENFVTIRTRMLELLWEDVEERLKKLPNLKGTERRRLLESYYGHMVTSFLEYDEGILGNDMQLAGSLYRCVYNADLSDPVALGHLVRYVRSEAKNLFDIETGELLAVGVSRWKVDDPKHHVGAEKSM